MSRTIEIEAFTFDELSDEAKEKARAWYREGALDYDWYECIYEDAATCGAILGIDLKQKPVKLMNGSTRYDPSIWFTGFSSQGDGACFEGNYTYARGCARKIRRHAPQDVELRHIADRLVVLQKAHGYRLEARTEHSGHYYHSGCMRVDVWMRDESRDVPDGAEGELRDTLRAFADWIYHQLEREYEYQMSDETVDESIRANGYEFDSDGERI